MANENLDAALDYLGRGWAAVPGHGVVDGGFCTCRQDDCERPGKHPRVKWGEYREHLPSETEVRRWFTRKGWEDSSVIIITGRLSNLVVLDIDPRHGGDETLRDWERQHGEMPMTPRSLTGGGGVHYLFAYPEGVNWIDTDSNVMPGLDIRADKNGYIVAPPSSHASGRTYEWDTEAHLEDTPLAPFPKKLLNAIVNRHRGGVATGGKSGFDVSGIIIGDVRVPEGSRNQALASVVGFLIHANPDDSVEEVYSLACGVVARSFDAGNKPMQEREIRATVESIFRRNARKEQAEAIVTQAKHGIEVRVDSEDMDPEDRAETAATIWQMAGLPTMTDWYMLVDSGTVEYILVTPEDEIRLGNDLLDYATIRKIIFNHAAVKLTEAKRPKTWDEDAYLLRKLARVEQVEASRASELVEEWVEDYLRQQPASVDPEPGQRRDWIRGGVLIVDDELWLRPQNLARFVEVTYGERYEARRMAKMLRRAGWESGSLADGAGSSIRGWHRRVA